MGKQRYKLQEKLELQRKFLQELAKFPEGITSKALLKNILGQIPKSGFSSFFNHWRGEEKPLIVSLTESQAEKLSLKVLGFNEYPDSVRPNNRTPIFFHPSFKKLYDALKPYEQKTVFTTPTRAGLEAEVSMGKMVESSQINVDKALQAIRGIELSFLCPHCGQPIKFREVSEKKT
jgi:hypothetical protein